MSIPCRSLLNRGRLILVNEDPVACNMCFKNVTFLGQSRIILSYNFTLQRNVVKSSIGFVKFVPSTATDPYAAECFCIVSIQ